MNKDPYRKPSEYSNEELTEMIDAMDHNIMIAAMNHARLYSPAAWETILLESRHSHEDPTLRGMENFFRENNLIVSIDLKPMFGTRNREQARRMIMEIRAGIQPCPIIMVIVNTAGHMFYHNYSHKTYITETAEAYKYAMSLVEKRTLDHEQHAYKNGTDLRLWPQIKLNQLT